MKNLVTGLLVFGSLFWTSCQDGVQLPDTVQDEDGTQMNGDFDTTQPMSIVVRSLPVSTRGIGTVGGVVGGDNLGWNGETVRIFAVNSRRIPDVSQRDDPQEAPLGSGVDVTLDNTASLVELVKNENEPFYYPRTGTFDFYAYYSDDAVSSDDRAGYYDEEKGAYYVPYVIDGTQDLLFAKGRLSDDDDRKITDAERQYLFGAHSSRMGWRPYLGFSHLLTRFTFEIEWGDDVRDDASKPDTRIAHEVYIRDISIKSRTSGRMYVIKPDDMDVLEWSDDDTANLQLRKYISEDSREMVSLNYGSSHNVVDPYKCSTKDELMEQLALHGLTVEQVLGCYHLDEHDTSKRIKVGESLLVEPGLTDYEVTMTVLQYYDKNGRLIPQETGMYTYTIPVSMIRDENKVPFQAGCTYNVVLKIYGLENIDVSVGLEDWNDGGSTGWDPDDF